MRTSSSTMIGELALPGIGREREYVGFPNEGGRNWRQEHMEIPVMLRALAIPRGVRVLEVGCGRGIALPAFARRLAPTRLVGLDLDASFLEEAQTRLAETGTEAELVHGDVRKLPFPNGDFDLVFDFGTCFHISRPEQALREITRVLAPGGVFATETGLSQLLSHPIRVRRRSLPWSEAPGLERTRHALLWETRRRVAG